MFVKNNEVNPRFKTLIQNSLNKLYFRGKSAADMVVFCDADLGRDFNSSRCTSGYLFCLRRLLLVDSHSSIYLVKKIKFRSRSKNIRNKFYFIGELIEMNKLILNYKEGDWWRECNKYIHNSQRSLI